VFHEDGGQVVGVQARCCRHDLRLLLLLVLLLLMLLLLVLLLLLLLGSCCCRCHGGVHDHVEVLTGGRRSSASGIRGVQ